MKIIFFGTSSFAAHILNIISKELEVVLVVTQPDKPVGRKQVISQSEVAKTAIEIGTEIYKPESLKAPEVAVKLKEYKADIFLVVAYGKIIPQNILDLPKLASVNIHGSILPKYRGASPIQAVLLNGEKETGITVMLMDKEMDHGDILRSAEINISPDDTFPILESKLAVLAESLIVPTIKDFAEKKIQPQKQNHIQATFTKIITKEDGLIQWNNSAENIYNTYRAYYIWPNIYTSWQGKKIKITNCALPQTELVNSSLAIGTVFVNGEHIAVQTGTGALELLEVQLEGKNPVKIQDFVRGYKDFSGSVLG